MFSWSSATSGGESPVIGRDVLSPREVEDLNRGRGFVRTIAESGGSTVQSSIQKAVDSLLDVHQYFSLYLSHSLSV